jgi:hypothetical protein
MKKNIFFIAFMIGLFYGCGGGSTKLISEQNNTVEVFTLGPVKNALVKDANNQIAIYDDNISAYVFQNPISYPITVYPTSSTYVDVDFDGKQSANDIIPKFTELKSFNNEVNLITNLYYSQEYNESNVTVSEYIQMVQDKFNVDLSSSPLNNESYAKLLYGAYNYFVENNITNLSDIDPSVDNVNIFFAQYLQNPDINNKIAYYALYDSLVNLDKRLIQRVDSIHKPDLSLLRNEFSYTYNDSVDVFDAYMQNGYIYTASGHEELAQFEDGENNITYIGKSNGDLLSFGFDLYDEMFNGRSCLFLADSKIGVKVFDITDDTLNNTAVISSYLDDVNEINITNEGVVSVNGYISPQESKRLLTISTLDKGFYLINMNNSFVDCNLTKELNTADDFLISYQSDPALANLVTFSSAIRKDGTYLYETTKDGIYGYDISILDKNNILASKSIYSVENGETPYSSLLINNDNELFVSTNKGVQVYDVDNNNNLNFISEYTTEGAKEGYISKIDFYNNYLFLTDGYKGLKVIKYDTSFQPMLCGAAYFAPASNNEELAKVNSVKYENGYLYVGVDSYGIVKLKLEDILFKHCK